MRKQELSPEVAKLWLDPLPAAEFESRLRTAIAELDGPELENLAALIRWFNRRYPTMKERSAYVRRRYASAVRLSGAARGRARDPFQ
jgi:hypothetical protein